MITEGLRGVMTLSAEERRMRQSRLVRYIVDSLSTHNSYSFGYFFCEMLNLLNVVCKINNFLERQSTKPSLITFRWSTSFSLTNSWAAVS